MVSVKKNNNIKASTLATRHFSQLVIKENFKMHHTRILIYIYTESRLVKNKKNKFE